jgi:hypothetical protein
MKADKSLSEVLTNAFPYDYWHDLYQEYYRKGLALYLRSIGLNLKLASRQQFPTILKVLRYVRDANSLRRLLGNNSGMVIEYLNWLARHAGAQYSPSAPLVGEYLFWPDCIPSVKMCIDSHDSGSISCPALLEKSDVYVKTNYWMGVDYDQRVIPFFNCNPVVLPYIDKLKAMRNQPPLYDICFIVRVWGGKTGIDGIEHCMRLLESVAKVRAKKFVLAELVSGDMTEQARRLRSNGIPTTTRRISLKQLWDISAKSRLNISRLGNHQAISWRMTDLLALGACTVLDQDPKTRWPVPLLQGQQYYSLGATTSNDEPVASTHQYAVIPELLDELLGKPNLNEDMRRQSAEYLDQHLHPIHIGRQLYNIVLTGRRSQTTIRPDPVPESEHTFIGELL